MLRPQARRTYPVWMSKKKSGQKRHHFVPACYLKAWLDPDAPKTERNNPYLWLFDKQGQGGRRKAPEKIFRESDMYTLTNAGGERDLRLEQALGTIESCFSRVRNSKFNFQRLLSDEDWRWVCLFAAVTHTRTEEMRNHWVGNMERLRDMTVAVAGADWGKAVQPDLAAKTAAQGLAGAYYPKPEDFLKLKETSISTLLTVAENVVAPRLQDMHKTVLTTDDELGFLTSDAPSAWHDPTAYRRHPHERAVGLETLDIEVTLPISPRQCLMFTHRPVGPAYLPINGGDLETLNHRHAFFAPSTIVVCRSQTRPRWFEVPLVPNDAWEARHPDRKDRMRWTNPACPSELLGQIDRLLK